MKKFILVVAIAGSLVSGQAIAACTDTRLDAAAISALLGGNTVCVPAVTVPTMTWQELHEGSSTSTSGVLTDFKRGPGPGPDPSKPVGTWSVSAAKPKGKDASVIHTYSGGGGTYTYTVHGTGVVGTNHSFCSAGPEIVARVKSLGGAC